MAPSSPLAARLRRIVKSVGRLGGIDIGRLGPHAQPELRRARLLEDGCVNVVLDVGANRGDYGREIRGGGYRGRIVSFEPLLDPFCRLQAAAAGDPAWDCHKLALGNDSTKRALNVAGNGGASSSFFGMSSELHDMDQSVRYVGSEDVEICPLDAVTEQLIGSSDRVWLKIDVQGYELEVLEGARHTLRSVHGLEIEMSLAALYEGQPLMHDVLGVIGGRGFELIDLWPAYRDLETGRVLQVDGVALRRS